MAESSADSQAQGLEHELIARSHRLPKFHLVEAQEHRDLAGVFKPLTEEEPSELCHCFDDQHAWHDRRSGVVALEEVFVHRDVLDADRPVFAIHFDHAVHQKHGVAVRERALDGANVHHPSVLDAEAPIHGRHLFTNRHPEPAIQAVARSIRHHPAPNRASHQVEVAEHVEDLVPDRLVFKAICIVDRAVVSDDQHVLGSQMAPNAAFPHRLSLFLEAEGAGGG